MNKRQAILLVAYELIAQHGFTTTRDIKEELRNRYPVDSWTQNTISRTMDTAYEKGGINGKELTYQDNGIYRVYVFKPSDSNFSALVQSNSVNANQKRSRTDIVKMMKNSGGKFMTVVFKKKDGEMRTMNGNVTKDNFQDEFGYIKFYEATKGHRKVDPKTIISLKIQGTTVVV